jgi:hypothetical protein
MTELVLKGLALRLQLACREHIRRDASLGIETLLPKDGGFRTADEQLHIFGRGRDYDKARGTWVVIDRKLVVTDALPEDAPHCRRAAYDLWVLFHGRRATMDPRDGWTPAEIAEQLRLWGQHVAIGHELGLVCGAHWPRLKDWPHFEIPEWRSMPLVGK